jgi:predicted transcriptional regulator
MLTYRYKRKVMGTSIKYVEREEARENFKHEALHSWAEYQETGRHLAGLEVHTWLNTWGTDEEKAAPECHE